MKKEKVHINTLEEKIKQGRSIVKKREREVIYLNGMFYKVWNQNWSQSLITEYCFNVGYYDNTNAECLHQFIYDETGPRGYITKTGEEIASRGSKDWKSLNKIFNKDEKLNFIKLILIKSLEANGMHADMFPSNMIRYKKNINLIDFDSFRSFDLIFRNKKSKFENFELDAWWKPHETAFREVNRSILGYMEHCLGINKSEIGIKHIKNESDIEIIIKYLDKI